MLEHKGPSCRGGGEHEAWDTLRNAAFKVFPQVVTPQIEGVGRKRELRCEQDKCVRSRKG